MRLCSIALIWLLLAPLQADAQVTTADGVRALAAGDTTLAFRILEPLAEGTSPDPVAQFFLGAMYATGAGVQPDFIRACGLYKRAAAAAHPIAQPARALADGFLDRAAPVAREMCESARTAVRSSPLTEVTDVASVRRLPRTAAADGIEAFVNGDYSRSADVFRPLAENWPGGVDETSSFFMAWLYQNGLGVTQDLVRACALYSRVDPGSRFYGTLVYGSSPALLETLNLSPRRVADCNMLSFIGFDHRFQPTIFTLEPGYWVDVELSGTVHGQLAAVAYQGTTQESELVATLSPGVRFLPIEYTPLDVRGLAPGRRHFIQAATWARSPTAGWDLIWSLFEVVRGRVLHITEQTLANVPDNISPDGDVDLGRLVRLRVNRDGNAEWAVLTGEKPTELIETEVERQEVRAQKESREAADKRVDWNQMRDAARNPSLAYSDSDGCANAFVYGWSADRMESIAIRAEKAALGLSISPGVFDLATTGQKLLELWIEVYDRPRLHLDHCSDMRFSNGVQTQKWRAVTGTITIQLSPTGVRALHPYQYKVWIRIDGAEFVSPSGRRIRANGPIFLNGLAGYFAG